MTKPLSLLAIFPESIGGRLTASSLFAGFRQLEHKVIFFDSLKDSDKTFENILKSNSFDFVVSYDYSALLYKKKFRLNIPAINYFSDVIDENHSGAYWREFYPMLKKKDSYTFYWDKELCSQAQKDIENLFYMPHFVNTEIYKNLNLKPQYDLMFAGRLDSEFRLTTFLRIAKNFSKLKIAWFAFEKHLEDALKRVDSQQEKEILKSCYQGFVDTEEKMALEINRSKIVFNFNAQGISSLNYRTFQVLACEKLLLSDYRSEIDELFSINKDFLCFKSIDELQEQIDFYLSHPQEASKIAHAGALRVQKNHCAKTCVEKMLNLIQK